MLIMFCLTILGVLTVFSLVLGSTLSGTIVGNFVDDSIVVNGTSSTFEINGLDVFFSIDPIIGALAIIISLVAVGVAVGIQVVGSGLSDQSVRLVIITSAYTGLWGVLSVLASPLILSIEMFGTLIYIVLTIVYIFGVVQSIGGSGEI